MMFSDNPQQEYLYQIVGISDSYVTWMLEISNIHIKIYETYILENLFWYSFTYW
jgi:hypothetical protein